MHMEAKLSVKHLSLHFTLIAHADERGYLPFLDMVARRYMRSVDRRRALAFPNDVYEVNKFGKRLATTLLFIG